jgi:hypothetical protein
MSAILSAVGGGIVGALIAFFGVSLLDGHGGFGGIQPGDWLQAFAAFAAVAFTMIGTLWLEDHKRNQARLDEQRLLRETLHRLKQEIALIRSPLEANLSLQQRIEATENQYGTVLRASKALSFSREHFRIQNYDAWVALNDIEREFSSAARKLMNEQSILSGSDRVTERVYEISRREIQTFAADIEGSVEAALVAIGHTKIGKAAFDVKKA